MNRTGEIIRGTVLLVVGVLTFGWLIVHTIRKAEDPAQMLFKWIFTAVIAAVMVWKVAPMVGQGGYGAAFGGIPFAAVCGLALAITWRHSLASLVAKPFASLYDGGDEEPEPRPAYSIALSRQKQGKYLEAIAEVRKQLDRFPTDFEGHMLLAQIQAEHLGDLPGAEITIQRLCDQPGHAPKNIAFALYSMADWHLKYGQDREAARRNLQKVIDLLPDSESALSAAQRIGHLGDTNTLVAPHDRKIFAVAEGERNIGLLKSHEHLKPAEIDPAQVAAEYVNHLASHPQDTDAREKLAVLYAGHYGRLDLAVDQLEQMIGQPNQPSKLVVHWLNLLADLQVRGGADYDTVCQTLHRITERYPHLAASQMALNRISLLKLELKAKSKNQDVKLGSYEQNIGLTQGLPRHHKL
jgi:tetratricopeptide (TPR) repeat protein